MHFYSAYVQNTALIGKDGFVPCVAYVKEASKNGLLLDLALRVVVDRTERRELGCRGVDGPGERIATHGRSALLASRSDLLALPLVNRQRRRIILFLQLWGETQLLETAFLTMFSLLADDRDGGHHPWTPSCRVLWLFRWLAFRISVGGAGLIKVRGGSWERRPASGIISKRSPYRLHYPSSSTFSLKRYCRGASTIDLIVQLYTSWLVLVPLTRVRRISGLLTNRVHGQHCGLGEFSVLNHLTILPSLACLDDGAWPRFLTKSTFPKKRNVGRRLTDVVLLLVIAYLSWPVVANLMVPRNQVMNTSFDPFKVVNTYGAFGSVGERYEPVVALSDDGKTWREVDLPCKPTDPAAAALASARPTTTAWTGTSGSSGSSRIDRCGNQPVRNIQAIASTPSRRQRRGAPDI